MNIHPTYTTMLFPTIGGWRPDLPSIIIGLILGLGLGIAAYKLRPYFLEQREQMAVWIRSQDTWLGDKSEFRFKKEIVALAQKRHLGHKWANMGDIFVKPRLLAPQFIDNTHDSLADSISYFYYLWPELAATVAIPPPPSISSDELLRKGKRILITGEPGSGKTTLLAYLAYRCAMDDIDKIDTPFAPKLPVLLHVAELNGPGFEHAGDKERTGNDPLTPLIEALLQRHEGIGRKSLSNLVRKKAEESNLLLLLDGFDELSTANRPRTVAWIDQLLEFYPNAQVLMACGLRGFGPLLNNGFNTSFLLPFRVGQATELGECWRKVARSGKHYPADTYWQPGQLMTDTNQRLMLALNADKNDTHELPDRRLKMFEGMLRLFLFRIAREVDGAWLAPAARDLWQRVAYQLLSKNSLLLNRNEVLELTTPVLDAYDVRVDKKTVNRLISTIETSELFVEYGENGIGFLNPLWRDFLASGYLAEKSLQQEVKEHLTDPGWANALRFYVGREGAGEMATMNLQSGDSPLDEGLFYLASWLPEAEDRDNWRRDVLVGLGRIIANPRLPVTWRQRAVLALVSTGEPGVVGLLSKLLIQNEPTLRQVALAAIARLKPQDVLLTIDRMLSDNEGNVRAVGVHALAWMADPSAEDSLIGSLLEPDQSMSWAAAEGLALNGSPGSWQILREAMTDEVQSVRRAAVEGLKYIDQPWAKEMLTLASHKDNQIAIQTAATSALQWLNGANGSLESQEQEPGSQSWLVRWAVSKGKIVPEGSEVIPYLVEALQDEDIHIRSTAAITLGQISSLEGREPLQSAIKDPQPDVRKAAFMALCQVDKAWECDIGKNGIT